MFVMLPTGKAMHVAQHAARDAAMGYALIGRVRPDLVPGLAWGLYCTATTEPLLLKRLARMAAKRPEVEFVVCPIQHGATP